MCVALPKQHWLGMISPRQIAESLFYKGFAMYDEEDEMRRFKTLLIAIGVIVFSLYLSWQEMKYLIFAEIATAQISEARIVENQGRRRRYKVLLVKFQFNEADGTGRSEKEEISPDSVLPDDGVVDVEYFPGVEDSARLAGTGSSWPFIIVIGAFAFMGYSLWKLIKEANTPIARGPRMRQ